MIRSLQPIRDVYGFLPQKARATIRQLIGSHPAGRRFLRQVYEESIDAYLISFPKCGRTWLRLLIGKAIAVQYGCEDENAMLELEPLTARLSPLGVPIIRVTHDDYPHHKLVNELSSDKSKYSQSKVIFLVRDVRDVVVSLYFEVQKRSGRVEGLQANGDIDQFLQSKCGSLDSVIQYYNIWASQRHVPRDFLLVKYEDLHADPNRQLRLVLDFLGMNEIGDDAVRIAVEFARFENMRDMETKRRFSADKLLPGDDTDPESYKTRRGKAHAFGDYLRPNSIDYINGKISAELSNFYGYSTEVNQST